MIKALFTRFKNAIGWGTQTNSIGFGKGQESNSINWGKAHDNNSIGFGSAFKKRNQNGKV